MKKRLLALALAALTVLPLAGCGKKGPDTDLAAIRKKGYMIVGITEFVPMDYKDENGQWIGFDADMAKAFADSLGVSVVFREIDWTTKHRALADGEIDVIWNGMTLTDEVQRQMDVSLPYCHNAQVVVLPNHKANDYPTEDSLRSLDFAAEDNSAGAKTLADYGFVCIPVEDQAKALDEVSNQTAGACVVDQFMAAAMTGPGTQHPDLTMAMELGSEVEDIVVGFRKGSDLVSAFNDFWVAAGDDGTLAATAETYNMSSFVLKR